MKYNIQSVRVFLQEHDCNNSCTLLSTEYQGVTKPLDFQCNLCGRTFQRTFNSLQRVKRYCCPNCSNSAGKRQLTIEAVQKFLDEHDTNQDCVLLSESVLSSKHELKFKCASCGNEFARTFESLKLVSHYCCSACAMKRAGQKNIKYTPEDVKNLLAEQGCSLLEPYTHIKAKIKCQCSKGHVFDFVLANFLRKQEPCIICSYESRRGPNSPLWKGGGNVETIDFLRHSLTEWKHDVLKQADYKCDICGEGGDDLVIHHAARNFSDILAEASANTNIPILFQISDYSDHDRNTLVSELQRLHTIDNGRVMKREYHRLFHRRFGTHNNTLEQYLIFKKEQQELLK